MKGAVQQQQQQLGRRAALSLHVDSSMRVVDRFVPPTRWWPVWREARKRWFNWTQTYMFSNRIALALRDQARAARAQAPKRIMALKRHVALSAQLLVPRFGFSKHRFARGDAAQLYTRLLDAHARADSAALKQLAADSYARSLLSEIKARQKSAPPLPPGASLHAAAHVERARAVNVRVVMNQQPPVEFAQVLVRFRLTHSVDVVVAGSPPRTLSRHVRRLDDVVAFERNLLDAKAGWRVLDKIRSDVLSDTSETPPPPPSH